MARSILELEGLTAWYDRRKPVVEDVSLSLVAGEAVGLIGINGAGKTTLLKALCQAHRGCSIKALRYRGRSIDPADSAFMKQRYLSFADDSSFPTWSLDTFVRFLDRAYSSRKRARLLDELVEGFNFGEYRGTPFSQLSSGSRKKASLIAAFHTQVDILFLDEPVDFLDFASTEYLYQRIVDAASHGQCVLLSSHIAESFTRCTTRLFVLSSGTMTGPFATPEDSRDVVSLIS
ncbi:ATP-binding cassette domain-containing protein [Actinomyces slackii]|uniref:Lipopolysaccharide export system ATP-binding protein LptB n=1 Tax=Actinomyces slackii TaxID=52774 RepID=A0A3S4WIM3_9ACTO|nr:ATP-binding cassette domain-containing protein [Actinomyces slackii]VEG73737.1 Lipopolysaccharide export system ATP-binding protein LptB [Actinomyces slackii]